MKILPNRKEVTDWFRQNSADQDYIHIPEGHSNAFVGVLAGTDCPTIAVLDFQVVVRNLMTRHGLSHKEAHQYALDRANNAPHYGPFLVAMYPGQQPTRFNEHE